MKKITIYSKVGCGECMFTKKFLESHQVDFVEHNLTHETDKIDDVKQLGFTSLPVVVVEGEEPFSGYQPDRLQEIVNSL
ncbi:glutaredoxin domain-containing protein [Hutsoniella sourekii]|uniref:glutaredoxin domain-containing protein n=1 Tax=Hutsoniella sourekii TaxID=87650 RepID=UPI00048A1A05|nr:glutaredoxin domain-containing protein [Hutsoniella sourekii]